MRCTMTGEPYTVFGYGGKQVRDNIHSADLVAAFDAFHRAPRSAAVYNIGGGRASNCSMLEAIERCEAIAGRELDWKLSDENRIGDHRWWISDLEPFRRDYPDWEITYGIDDVLREIYEHNAELWLTRAELALAAARSCRSSSRPTTRPTRSGRPSRRTVGELERAGIDHEILVIDDASGDGTADVVAAIAAEHPTRPLRALAPAARLRPRGPRRARAVHRRRGRDHDGRPVGLAAGPRPLLPRARAGLRLRVRHALRPGGRTHDYPRLKLVLNRIGKRGHPGPLPARLQRHDERVQGLPPRRDRPAPAAALEPLQPDRRAAAQGDRARLHLRGRSGQLDEPATRRLEAATFRRWAAATCSSSSTCGSSITSAEATTAAGTCRTTGPAVPPPVERALSGRP